MRRKAAALIPALFVLLSLPLGQLRAGGRIPAAPPAGSHEGGAAASALLDAAESSSPSRELILTWVNFLILVGALVYLLRRPLSDFFADRLDAIHEGLEKGREALRASDARLAEVEKKLASLESEIAEFRAGAERDMQAEAARLREGAEREAARILDVARAQIEAAARAAQAELRRFTAGQAVSLAESLIRERLDEPARRRLVSRFVVELKGPEVRN